MRTAFSKRRLFHFLNKNVASIFLKQWIIVIMKLSSFRLYITFQAGVAYISAGYGQRTEGALKVISAISLRIGRLPDHTTILSLWNLEASFYMYKQGPSLFDDYRYSNIIFTSLNLVYSRGSLLLSDELVYCVMNNLRFVILQFNFWCSMSTINMSDSVSENDILSIIIHTFKTIYIRN